jgi:hypothetical protein
MEEAFMRRLSVILFGLLLLTLLLGCGSKPPAEESAASPSPATEPAPGTNPAPGKATTSSGSAAKQPGMLDRLMAKNITIPEGTVLHVRLDQALSSKTATAGDEFSATVDTPVTIDGKVAIPKGAEASGHVVAAKSLGKFKGQAMLQITVDNVSFGGNNYTVDTSSVARTAKGKGKRTAVMIGGGAGLGALIGGLAGGGKGAAIGAGVGAGAGTAGAYYTGNKEVVLPAESLLAFKLMKSVEVKP